MGIFFVADGHGSNNRIVKYSKDGKFIKAWGKTGYAPGEFRVVHCIAMDKRGRVFVCDRSNTRIQIFDQEGTYLATWHQFGMPSGIAFSVNDEDLIYVFDSESDNVDNPGFEEGIRIGDALNGWVKYFILDPGGNPGTTTGSGAEFGTVDKFGNVFAGEPRPRVLRKYVKRVQIFDQDGNFIAAWKQFGRPSAVFVSKDDTLYVSDSHSNSTVNPGYTRGITIGSAKDGSLKAFIPDPDLAQADVNRISGASGIVADDQGTIYAADVGPHKLRKYVKVK